MRKVVCDQRLRPNVPNWWQSYEVSPAEVEHAASKHQRCKIMRHDERELDIINLYYSWGFV